MRKKIIRRKLKRLKLEVRELLGMLSINELTTNWNLAKRFQVIDEEFLYV